MTLHYIAISAFVATINGMDTKSASIDTMIPFDFSTQMFVLRLDKSV
jgi:hypothetical protein